MIKKLGVLFLFGISSSLFASEAVPIGKISELSYRGGYVTFRVVNDQGVNYCSACPTDPGNRGAGKCWVKESKTVQIGMLLSAQARGKKIYGRVGGFSTSCEVYQMSVED